MTYKLVGKEGIVSFIHKKKSILDQFLVSFLFIKNII